MRKLEEKDHLEELGVDWKIILIWFFKKWDGDWSGSGQGHVAGSRECGEFLD